MRGVDTNVLVRLLTADDVKQAKLARAVMEAGEVFVPITVAIETEWVLRSGYGLAPEHVAAALRGIGGLPGVTFEEPLKIALALEWMEAGMDFADALHLVKSAQCSAFVTFDRKLAKRARGLTTIPITML